MKIFALFRARESTRHQRGIFPFLILSIFIVVCTLMFFMFTQIASQRKDFLEGIEYRFNVLKEFHEEIFRNDFLVLLERIDFVVKNKIFALYGADYEKTQEDAVYEKQFELTKTKTEEYLKKNLSLKDFVLFGIFERNGLEIFRLYSEGPPVDNKEVLFKVLKGFHYISPLAYQEDIGSYVDYYVPFIDKKGGDVPKEIKYVFFIRIVLKDLMHKIFKPYVFDPGSRDHLQGSVLQKSSDQALEILDPYKGFIPYSGTEKSLPLRFALRDSQLQEGRKVFSKSWKMFQGKNFFDPSYPWEIYIEMDGKYLLSDLRSRQISLFIFVGLIVLSILVVMFVFWFKQLMIYNRLFVGQYRKFLRKLQDQNQIQTSINNFLQEGVTYEDYQGNYIYINPAFAGFMNRVQQDFLHQPKKLFWIDEGYQRLAKIQENTIQQGFSVVKQEKLIIQEKEFIFDIFHRPLYAKYSRKIKGFITVYHDRTELLQVKQDRNDLLEGYIQNFYTFFEKKDPNFAFYRSLVSFVSLKLADRLNFSLSEREHVEICGRFAFFWPWFRNKNTSSFGSLWNGESEERDFQICKNALHKIMDSIPFLRLMHDTLDQMHECMDAGCSELRVGKVSLSASVLAAADGFCSHMKKSFFGTSVQKADMLKFVSVMTDKYPQEVIQALKNYIEDDEERRLLKDRVHNFQA